MNLLRAASLAILLLLPLLPAGLALSASTPDTSRALKTLMDDSYPMVELPAKGPAQGDGKGALVTVVKGDTLAKILARYPDLMPPSQPQLYKAVVALNPQAFIEGNPNRMVVGAQLQLPGAAELHAKALGRTAQKPSAKDQYPDAKPKDPSQAGVGYSHREDPHAGWVRYPSR